MKANLVRAIKVVLAMVGGLIILAILPPQFGEFLPLVLLGCGVAAFWWTRDKSAVVVVGPTPISSAAPTSQLIRRGHQKLWGTSIAFVVGLGLLIVWLYSTSEGERHDSFRSAIAEKTQEMLGPNFDVESVSLPNGIGSYETVAVVIFKMVADGKRDSLTMVTTGDCGDVCRIRMDPRDALRLSPLR
ncbi:MAG TPA: hypothetical protein VIL30_11505 [Ramlibacter sp.]|jgi:hypothetical protein